MSRDDTPARGKSRDERIQAAFKGLWTALAQLAVAALVATALVLVGAAVSGSGADESDWEGFEYVLAAFALGPLAAAIAGPFIARRLRLAAWPAFFCPVLVAVAVVFFGASGGLVLGSVALVACAVAIGYAGGLRHR
ncbi:hypothetical protein SAMN05216298_0462 [Glycomyces sambucus]|uniref:Uncharacterized protein n=1 Tax=Glycomyces sambucus TaxID=380244 RepID=A0A1G9CR52_9ACTN|nr:hypothetical protein [Glycomyces sambucus]SDK53914.1 hypothetical protein SAMN05216298_0462 [Glycomyces sambucus]